MSLSKSQRAQVFAMFDGKCAYCGCDLPERGWHADHIEPIMREWWKKRPVKMVDIVDGKIRTWEEKQKAGVLRPENERFDNYFPACRACNIDKSCMPLESWREWLEHKPTVLRNNHSAWRHAERFGLVAVVQTKVVFYFEKQSLRSALTPEATPEEGTC